MSEADLLSTQIRTSMMSLGFVAGDQKIGINWHGKLQEKKIKKWKDVPNLQSEEFRKFLDFDFYWSKDLQKL